MQRQEPTYETNIDLESDDSLPADQEMQIYAPSNHGDPENRSIQGHNSRGHASSSSSHRYSNIGFPSEADSRINYYINDGDDDDDDNDGGEGARRTHSAGETPESSHPQRFSADVGEEGNVMQVHAIIHNITDEGINNSR